MKMRPAGAVFSLYIPTVAPSLLIIITVMIIPFMNCLPLFHVSTATTRGDVIVFSFYPWLAWLLKFGGDQRGREKCTSK